MARLTAARFVFSTALILLLPHPSLAQSPAPRGTRILDHNQVVISYDAAGALWQIANDTLTVSLGLGPDGTLRIFGLEASGAEPVSLDSAADTFLTVDEHVEALGWRTGFAYAGYEALDRPGGAELAIKFQTRTGGLIATRHYAVYVSAPVIEMWTTLASSDDADPTLMSNLNGYDLELPAGTVNWINGLQVGDAGGGAFSLQHHSLAAGEQLRLGAESRASEAAVPWWLVDNGEAQLFGGLMWSGAWSADFAREGESLHLTLGLSQTATELQVGRQLEMPHAFLGLTVGGFQSASTAMRAFIADGIRQGRPFEAPVVYNTWFVYGTRIDQDLIREKMRHVAELGVEIFVLDAGWYLGSGDSDIFDFETGLGSWAVDPARFPDGLQSLTQYAHSLGMRFGLWVEPGRTAMRWINQPGLTREEWLVTRNGQYQPGLTNQNAKVGQVCFADERARAWVMDRLVALIDRVAPDYLKWDDNQWTNCDRAGHGHGAADGNFRQVEGLYSLLGELRDRYPQMLIENVSGGGNRLDFAMFRYSDIGWMDDRSVPAQVVRHNLEGLSTVFPPAYLFSFVMGNSSEPLAHAEDLSLLARSRMPGVLGVSVETSDLTESEFTLLTEEIAIYKHLRPILQDSSAVLLLPQAPRAESASWEAMQLTSHSRGDAVIFAFANRDAPSRVIVRPYGLDPGARYLVESIDVGPLGIANGAELTSFGIELSRSSVTDGHILVLHRQ